jgi:hypothetical protein
MNFKDVFISYGRQESKHFASKLYQSLIKEGLEVWFDQNDIPLGSDFQAQIDEGIEKAHNFVFIISPHSVNSPYCLKEILLAIKRGKRIIPILHVEPKDNYHKLHPKIAKINWVYIREQFDENMPQHEWKAIDDYEKGLSNLLALFEFEKDYVQKHTELLDKAIGWEKNAKPTELLLVGTEREAAQNWLLQEYSQYPCEPTALHAEFITESKKNGENLQTDLFFSFSESDIKTKDAVLQALSRKSLTAWTHKRDIKKGSEFDKAIEEGIERADNIIFFVSPSSVNSQWCLKELTYAKSLNKRIIPLLIEPTQNLPEQIFGLQYIDFTDNELRRPEETLDVKLIEDKMHNENASWVLSKNEKSDFQKDIDELIAILRIDQEYHWLHKTMLVHALRWQRQQNNPALLLRGFNLDKARTWLEANLNRSTYPPTDLHVKYIEQSSASVGQLNTDVFLSYSRKDGDFARKLNIALQNQGKTTWFDQESIAEASDFKAEIFKGIATSDNFLFVISPDSVSSVYCEEEVHFAASMGKRIITVLSRYTDPEILPEDLRAIQWIDFQKQGFERGFSQLLRAIEIDREYVAAHTKLSQRTLEWSNKDRSHDLLLRGQELKDSEDWLESNKNKKPAPTAQMVDFVRRSREVSDLQEARYFKEQFEKLALLERQQVVEDSLARKDNNRFAYTLIFGAFISLLTLAFFYNTGQSSLQMQILELGYALFALFFFTLMGIVNAFIFYQRLMRRAGKYYQSLMTLATEWKSGNQEVLLNLAEIKIAKRWVENFVVRRKKFKLAKIQEEFLAESEKNPAQRSKVRRKIVSQTETLRAKRVFYRRILLLVLALMAISYPLFITESSPVVGFLVHNVLSMSILGFLGLIIRKIAKEYQELESRREISSHAALWELCNRDPNLLIENSLLAVAMSWQKQNPSELSAAENEFITQSYKAFKAQNPEKEPYYSNFLDKLFTKRNLIIAIILLIINLFFYTTWLEDYKPEPVLQEQAPEKLEEPQPDQELNTEPTQEDSLSY